MGFALLLDRHILCHVWKCNLPYKYDGGRWQKRYCVCLTACVLRSEVFDLMNGRATGEICEQLWARINATVKSDRLSSHVHFEVRCVSGSCFFSLRFCTLQDRLNRQVLHDARRCEREFCAKNMSLLRSNKREEARLLKLLEEEVKKLAAPSLSRFLTLKDIFRWAEDMRMGLIEAEVGCVLKSLG